jgi:hypothetical protein
LAGHNGSLRFVTNDYAADEFREAKGEVAVYKELQKYSKYIIYGGHTVA